MLAETGIVTPMPTTASFVLPSDADAVRDGLRDALGLSPLDRLSDDDRGTAEIVLAEVLNNVVEHAYATHSGDIRLFLSLGDGSLHCVIEDEGHPMPGGNPPAGNLPDPKEMPEGGFGWHLIRILSSDLRYERDGRCNRLSFSLPAEQSAG